MDGRRHHHGWGGQAFAISYVGGTGNDVVLTALAAPVPTLTPVALIALMMMLVFVALTAVRR